MTQSVRVRFAPSPTGPLHIGGVRTALFNYLFAKKHQGTFYVRIEDTDQTRFVEGAEKYIFDALAWLGIEPDETIGKNEKYGPYKQSERKHLYKKYAQQLVDSGNAYYAFDTAEELGVLRKIAEQEGKTFIYNSSTREQLNNSLNLSAEETQERLTNNQPYVVRFKTLAGEEIVVEDLVRNQVKFSTSLLDDKVLFKSDGMPTYHLANIVDDHLQKTTHVIRGEEWLPSLPLHVMLYKAFGWEVPKFAHLPLILKPVGNGKLSKRDGEKLGFPVFPLEWQSPAGEQSSGYRDCGFFPEAVVNFLALLGWNDGTDKELYSLDELIAAFDLARVNKAGAKFDPEKNKWFNHQYLVSKSDSELAQLFLPILNKKDIQVDVNFVEQVVGLIKERADFVTDFYDLADFFFVAPTDIDPKVTKKWDDETAQYLSQLKDIINNIDDFEAPNIEKTIKQYITDNSLGIGKVMQPLRVSLAGSMKGPDVFAIAALLGKQECLQRIDLCLSKIS